MIPSDGKEWVLLLLGALAGYYVVHNVRAHGGSAVPGRS